MVVCPNCGKATRVAHTEVNGKNVRTCKKCGASLDKEFAKTVKKEAKKAVKTAKKAEITENNAENAEVKPAKTATKKSKETAQVK